MTRSVNNGTYHGPKYLCACFRDLSGSICDECECKDSVSKWLIEPELRTRENKGGQIAQDSAIDVAAIDGLEISGYQTRAPNCMCNFVLRRGRSTPYFYVICDEISRHYVCWGRKV